MWTRPSKEEVEKIRTKYPEGTIIKIIKMDDPTPVPPGTCGIVNHVDDIGTIHVDYLNHRSSLGIIPDKDIFKVIQLSDIQKEVCKRLHDSIKGKGYHYYEFKSASDIFDDAVKKESQRLSNCWDGPFDKRPEASMKRINDDFKEMMRK